MQVGGRTVHFLVSHPTPPVFDGLEDRNGTRNHDEIRFWADYVRKADYIYDDAGQRGGLRPGSTSPSPATRTPTRMTVTPFPVRHNNFSTPPRELDARADERGCRRSHAAAGRGQPDPHHPGRPRHRRLLRAPGQPRVDYVLPSKQLRIKDSGVFWPVSSDPLSALTGTYPFSLQRSPAGVGRRAGARKGPLDD